jgi:hypothetical protein
MRLRPARDVVPATDIGALFDQATDAHRSHPDEHACNRAAHTSKSTPPTPADIHCTLHIAHADQCNPFALLRMKPAFIVTSNSTYYAVHHGQLAALYCPITVNQASRRAFHLPSIECPPNRRVPLKPRHFISLSHSSRV